MQKERLIAAADAVRGEFSFPGKRGFTAASVSAALITRKGSLYTGICIDVACGMGFCAEHSAIADMLKHRETHVLEIVALNKHGIIPPCGRCREFLYQVNPANIDTRVYLPQDNVATLDELLPVHWLKFKGGVP